MITLVVYNADGAPEGCDIFADTPEEQALLGQIQVISRSESDCESGADWMWTEHGSPFVIKRADYEAFVRRDEEEYGLSSDKDKETA